MSLEINLDDVSVPWENLSILHRIVNDNVRTVQIAMFRQRDDLICDSEEVEELIDYEFISFMRALFALKVFTLDELAERVSFSKEDLEVWANEDPSIGVQHPESLPDKAMYEHYIKSAAELCRAKLSID